MILPTHALVGAVIGENINSSWLVAILAVVVHFIMDAFRHGEYLYANSKKNTFRNSWWKVILEVSSAVFLIFLLFYFKNPAPEIKKNIFIGALFSVLPDLVTFIYWLNNQFSGRTNYFLEKYYFFHSKIHRYPRNAPERVWNFRNARNDIIISALAIILLLFT
ncbi:MAG TPA: hypothetical protein VK255_00655 [Patescibacteria group bacterium]|nr:hypothetical protein [Patescibacteria group bacterium]